MFKQPVKYLVWRDLEILHRSLNDTRLMFRASAIAHRCTSWSHRSNGLPRPHSASESSAWAFPRRRPGVSVADSEPQVGSRCRTGVRIASAAIRRHQVRGWARLVRTLGLFLGWRAHWLASLEIVACPGSPGEVLAEVGHFPFSFSRKVVR